MKYHAEGGGKRASAAQQKSARFHGLPDSEIYTTEYLYQFHLLNTTGKGDPCKKASSWRERERVPNDSNECHFPGLIFMFG